MKGKVLLTTAVVCTTIALSYGGFKYLKPEVDTMVNKQEVVSAEREMQALRTALGNAKSRAEADNIANNAILRLKALQPGNQAQLKTELKGYIDFLVSPYKKMGDQKESVQSEAAVKILCSFPRETISMALSAADIYLFTSQQHLEAAAFIAYKSVESNPAVREYAEGQFMEAIISKKGNWGAKFVATFVADRLDMVKLSMPIMDAIIDGLPLASGVPQGVLESMQKASERLARKAKDAYLKKYGGFKLKGMTPVKTGEE
ncbi:MAG: hypothetical protein ACP5H8_01885 [Candidatus Micrarchaeia archaeon]